MPFEDWNDIPDMLKENRQEFGNVRLDNKMFNRKIYCYDAFSQDGTLGYQTMDDFISIITNESIGGEYSIQLRQTTTLPQPIIEAKLEKATDNFNQDEKDPATFFYSSRRLTYLVKTNINLNKRLLFFSEESIYGNAQNPDGTVDNQIRNIDFYVVGSFTPTLEADGTFNYGTLTLKKVNSFSVDKRVSDGVGGEITNLVYVSFKFYRAPIQASNIKRMRLTFEGPVILWNFEARNSANIAIPYKLTQSTVNKWHENLFAWNRKGNAVEFSPLWSQQFWMYENLYNKFGETFEVNGLVDSVHNDTITTDNNGYYYVFGVNNSLQNAFPNYQYRDSVLELLKTTGFSGKFPSDQELNELMSSAEPYLLPKGRDLFGVSKSFDSTQFGTLPRNANTSNPIWKQNTTQVIYLLDKAETSSEFSLGAGYEVQHIFYSGPILNEDTAAQQFHYSDPYFPSDLRKTNKSKLLQKNLVWMGANWFATPPTRLEANIEIDFAEDPAKWDSSVLESTLGLWPKNIDQSVNGADITNVTEKTYELSHKTSLFTSAQLWIDYFRKNEYLNLKLETAQFFIQDGNKYVIEFEFDFPIDVETFVRKQYYGGYQYTVETFSNSEEDAKVKGDIPTIMFTEGNGTIHYSVPQTYIAINRLGDPLLTVEDTIFGVSGEPVPMVKSKSIPTTISKKRFFKRDK